MAFHAQYLPQDMESSDRLSKFFVILAMALNLIGIENQSDRSFEQTIVESDRTLSELMNVGVFLRHPNLQD